MAGCYVWVKENDRDYGNLKGSRFIAQTHGCSCCSEVVKVGPADIRDHIDELEGEIAKARDILERMEREGHQTPA